MLGYDDINMNELSGNVFSELKSSMTPFENKDVNAKVIKLSKDVQIIVYGQGSRFSKYEKRDCFITITLLVGEFLRYELIKIFEQYDEDINECLNKINFSKNNSPSNLNNKFIQLSITMEPTNISIIDEFNQDTEEHVVSIEYSKNGYIDKKFSFRNIE